MLKGKVALITGAGRGIGRAVARRLAASGAAVAVVARTSAELDETAGLVAQAGGSCLPLPGDVTLADDVERVVAQTIERFNALDVLVNNAGIAPLATIQQMSPDDFDRLIAVNVRAVFLCCRAAWPYLAGRDGAIVNISSVAAVDPFPGFSAYGASKAFVNTYSRALAQEGQSQGIRVFCVAPGAVDTDMLRGPFPDFPKDQTLSPDDIAAFVESLLAPACRFVGGQPITIKRG